MDRLHDRVSPRRRECRSEWGDRVHRADHTARAPTTLGQRPPTPTPRFGPRRREFPPGRRPDRKDYRRARRTPRRGDHRTDRGPRLHRTPHEEAGMTTSGARPSGLVFEVTGLGYTYPGAAEPALSEIRLSIERRSEERRVGNGT